MILVRARFYKVFTRLCHWMETERSESTLCGKKPLEIHVVNYPTTGYEPTCASCTMLRNDKEKPNECD